MTIRKRGRPRAAHVNERPFFDLRCPVCRLALTDILLRGGKTPEECAALLAALDAVPKTLANRGTPC